MVIRLALALRQQFSIHNQVPEHVDVFKYLGRLLSQDDDDIQPTVKALLLERERKLKGEHERRWCVEYGALC
jgi:hypothetical protein